MIKWQKPAWRQTVAACVVVVLCVPVWGDSGTVDRAQALMDRGEYAGALSLLVPLIEARPMNPEAVFLAGLAALRTARASAWSWHGPFSSGAKMRWRMHNLSPYWPGTFPHRW